MKNETAPISQARLTRLALAAQLYLLRLARWIVAVAGVAGPLEQALTRIAGPIVDAFAMIIVRIIVIKAALLIDTPARKSGGPPKHEIRAFQRAVIGARLRKVARGPMDLRGRIAGLM